jgi:hypothetical protein
MEQGAMVNSCFFCALLHPERPDCPLCGKKPRFVPAQMMDQDSARSECADLVKTKAPAEEILRFVHLHGAASLEGTGMTLEALKRAYKGA